MDTTNAIKTITRAANLQSQNIAKIIGIEPSSYAMFINGELKQIERLIMICEICGCQLQITNNNGMTITLDSGNKKTSKR
ncbi:MAG: hypothetical protein IJG43_06510 [Acidaminococcaceae bacterium]|nr:hypothetical protein [Acidaminococcaceae bacterium]